MKTLNSGALNCVSACMPLYETVFLFAVCMLQQTNPGKTVSYCEGLCTLVLSLDKAIRIEALLIMIVWEQPCLTTEWHCCTYKLHFLILHCKNQQVCHMLSTLNCYNMASITIKSIVYKITSKLFMLHESLHSKDTIVYQRKALYFDKTEWGKCLLGKHKLCSQPCYPHSGHWLKDRQADG